MQNTFQRRKIHTLVIGSGAAGLTAAVRLHAQGIRDLAIYTEGLALGTSINTGSDKQTYYKLGMYGREADSPFLMAQDFLRGGAMHGDIALVEAALSPMAFAHLAALGVPAENLIAFDRGAKLSLDGAELFAVHAEHTEDSIGLVVRADGICVYFTADTL